MYSSHHVTLRPAALTITRRGKGANRRQQSWPRKSGQDDKWSFCLTAGKISPRIRRDHEQTSAPDAHTGLQGKGGACGHQGRVDAGSLAEHFNVHPNQITQWKAQLSEWAANVFGPGGNATMQPSVDVKGLHAKIGELTLENDFLEGALTKAGLLSARR